jgi:hypothetical protein
MSSSSPATAAARLEAMAKESSVSASASDPQATGEIPLIWCTECGGGRIMKRTSWKSWSLGQVFYCCPNYKVSDGLIHGGFVLR